MEWNKDALEHVESIPLPPIMAYLAKLDAELRTRKKGKSTVDLETARQTEKGYERMLGSEVMDVLKTLSQGEPVDLPDEFFEDAGEELFSVQICPAKYGGCTREKREMILQALRAVTKRLKELDTTRIMMEKAHPPLMSHHAFKVSIIGCPNCCQTPYFSDCGIIAVYKPAVKKDGCIRCELCVKACSEHAIELNGDVPEIDYSKCVMCGQCVVDCPKDVMYTREKGYNVVLGGTGARHPRIAQTVSSCTGLEGGIKIIENALATYEQYHEGDAELSFHEFIERAGVAGLKKIQDTESRSRNSE